MEQKKVFKDGWQGHYIADPYVLKAVSFVMYLLKDGKTMSEALKISSGHHKVDITKIAVELMVEKFIRNSDKGK